MYNAIMRFRYENLQVGDVILDYIDKCYDLVNAFPRNEQYSLASQILRSANSVYLNIAEGSARNSKREFARFITISLGSLVESHAGLKIALRRKYISEDELEMISSTVSEIWFKLCKLRKSQLEE